jgi:hypothetical protein
MDELSREARALIGALVADAEDVREGMKDPEFDEAALHAPVHVWEEVRAAFPLDVEQITDVGDGYYVIGHETEEA